MRIRFIIDFVKLCLCWPLGILLSKRRNIYLLAERGTDARDNGYHLFKYIAQNHSEAEAYFVIDKKSADHEKVASLGKTIHYRSWKHCVYFVASRYKISTHVFGYAPMEPGYYLRIQRLLPVPGKHIFLQHGVTKEDIPVLHGDYISPDLFICGAQPEYEFIKDTFGHPNGVVQYTGFARYDNLHGHSTKEQILIMPTWRSYLQKLNRDTFMETEYFKKWSAVLQSPALKELLKKHDLKLYFYPHYEMQKYIDCFAVDSPNIVMARFDEYDVQQLLIESKLLITDYSSVFFDFAYMGKPSLYYQFDTQTYYAKHYPKGYFDFSQNGFGEVVTDSSELLLALERAVQADFAIASEYRKRIQEFFVLYDTHNCERIFQAIEALS